MNEKWAQDKLGNITLKIADRDHFTPTYVDEGVLMVSPKDISEDEKIDFTKCKYITREAHERNCKKTDLKVDDLVFTRIGALLGKVCLVEPWMPEFSILHSAAMIRANTKIIDSRYLMYFIKSFQFQSQIKNEVQSIGVPDLGLDKIKRFNISYPQNTNAQRKIARILSTADAVIEKTQTTIAKYEAIKQGMLHDLFTRGIDTKTGKLRPKYEDAPSFYKESKLGWIPMEWEVLQISDCIDPIMSNVDKHIYEDELKIMLCNYMDVYDNRYLTKHISFSRGTVNAVELHKFSLKPQDVIITKDSETPDDIAVPTVLIKKIENLICGYHLCI